MGPREAGLLGRLWEYQQVRFPLKAYLPMVVVASFAAVAWSRAALGVGGLSWWALATVALTLLAVFFLLRVLDEHKDAAVDAVSRPELPVPRGLVTLGELRLVAVVVLAPSVAMSVALSPALLLPLVLVGAWVTLMAREFFVRAWLRERLFWYLLSHMVVMPLLFLFATAVDWLPAAVEVGWWGTGLADAAVSTRGIGSPPGLAWFLAFTFMNGLIIEIGRKLKAPGEERPGVDTYTGAWGIPVAGSAWLAALAGAVASAWMALDATPGSPWRLAGGASPGGEGGMGLPGVILLVALGTLAVLSALPTLRLVTRPGSARGKAIEAASGVWTLGSYLALGAVSLWAGGGL